MNNLTEQSRSFVIDQVDLRSKQVASLLDGAAGRAEELAAYLRSAGDKRSFKRPHPLVRLWPTFAIALGTMAAGLVLGSIIGHRER